MWFPAIWLTIGFAKKWAEEYWERRGGDVFRFLYIMMSFALVIVTFGFLQLTIWQALLVFFFWILVTDMVKPS